MKKQTTPTIGFAAFAPKTAVAAKKDEKPTMPATPELLSKVDRFVTESEQLKALTGSVDILKNELRSDAYPFWVSQASGGKFVSSVILPGKEAEAGVMVSFKNDKRIVLGDVDGAKELIGHQFPDLFEEQQGFALQLAAVPDTFVNSELAEAVEAHVATVTTGKNTPAKVAKAEALRNNLPTGQVAFVTELLGLLKGLDVSPSNVVKVSIAVDAIPEEKQGAFFAGVMGIADRLGIPADQLVAATSKVVPVADYNEKRMTLLPLKVNVALDEVYKTPSMVKVR